MLGLKLIHVSKRGPRGHFYLHGLTLFPAWISSYIRHEMCDEITYQLLRCTDEVWEWISNSIPSFTGHVITYPCWCGVKPVVQYQSSNPKGYGYNWPAPNHNQTQPSAKPCMVFGMYSPSSWYHMEVTTKWLLICRWHLHYKLTLSLIGWVQT